MRLSWAKSAWDVDLRAARVLGLRMLAEKSTNRLAAPLPAAETMCSATSRRASDKGLLSISLTDYLRLLDVTGRAVRDDKRGAIPSDTAPILERIGLFKETWVDLICNYQDRFGHFVGSSQTLVERAQQAGRKWYRGKPCCAAVFD